jgi:hypothetical protein
MEKKEEFNYTKHMLGLLDDNGERAYWMGGFCESYYWKVQLLNE